LSDFVLPTAFYDQTETIGAAYVMGQYDDGPLNITAGVRMEYYKLENAGTALLNGNETALSTVDDTVDFFPSINLSYDVTQELVLRLAGQRGVSRPAYAFG
ncbi:MAG: TonB-dependent receptor, partial [Pseudomonas sp.]|nr:TonB-dependent receptor [Pseudomonas sp.]